MKSLYRIFLVTTFTLILARAYSQEINWKTLKPSDRHIINLNVGLNNSFEVGIGYAYHLNTKMPILMNIEYSMPFGDRLFDDHKTKIGGQVNLFRSNSFYSTISAYGIIRRFQNDVTRMINFGSEFSVTAGFYQKKWFAAGEFGFDKAITTHIKHSERMKEYNPDLQDGWYIPTGGNFLYGVKGGYSFNRHSVYAKAGNTISQDLRTNSTLPYYFQVGINVGLGR